MESIFYATAFFTNSAASLNCIADCTFNPLSSINIFGGIVRCDRVAAGVIEAYNNLGNINIPIIVRLQGTNAVEAKKLIDESGLKVQSAIQLSEAAELVKKAVA